MSSGRRPAECKFRPPTGRSFFSSGIVVRPAGGRPEPFPAVGRNFPQLGNRGPSGRRPPGILFRPSAGTFGRTEFLPPCQNPRILKKR